MHISHKVGSIVQRMDAHLLCREQRLPLRVLFAGHAPAGEVRRRLRAIGPVVAARWPVGHGHSGTVRVGGCCTSVVRHQLLLPGCHLQEQKVGTLAEVRTNVSIKRCCRRCYENATTPQLTMQCLMIP